LSPGPCAICIVITVIPPPPVREYSLFNVYYSNEMYRSGRCGLDSDVVCWDVDVFGTRPFSHNRSL
jgi:hypothetical protein